MSTTSNRFINIFLNKDEGAIDFLHLLTAKYIRVDYDQEGHEDVVHTKVHLHVGVYKTNFRIPVSHYLTPKDFLYLILKYVYHSKDKFIDKLIVNKERKNL